MQAIGSQTVTNAVFFGADAFSVGGSSDLTLSGPINFGSSAYAPTIVTVSNIGNTTYSSLLTNTAGFVKAGSSMLTLSGTRANTYGSTTANGNTTVSGGTLTLAKTAGVAAVPNGSLIVNAGGRLLLGAANQIADAVPLSLNGGVFQTAGYSEQLGTLKVTASSSIDLGAGSSVLAFAGSSAVVWTGGTLLTLSNWSGSIAGGGPNRVVFGSSSLGLTSAQVSQIRFANPPGFPSGLWAAAILSTGEAVPFTAAPSLTAQPQDRFAVAGDTVAFTCSASGTPAPAYQWRFNGTNLSGAAAATLLLTNVAMDQAGTYSALVTNVAGSKTSLYALLSVYASAMPTLNTAGYLAGGQFTLSQAGVPGYKYAIWVSTDLSNWNALQTNSSPFAFTDRTAGGSPYRFYRARYSP